MSAQEAELVQEQALEDVGVGRGRVRDTGQRQQLVRAAAACRAATWSSKGGACTW
ncbi:hypothetical protein ACTWPT_50570 [Nonomuraea sp. 3N208]|uniref:hypothetical protein n=1 Tax=Nonomuraea sp. 3N208 TaxID=3457421 RepID=UPI003FD181AB